MKKFAFFDYGFRPFFLGAGFYALATVPLWLFLFAGQITPSLALNPLRWHMHEMLFGFIGAAIAGFILTAVPNWTGQRGWAGGKLIILFLLWLAGRLAVFPLLATPLALAALIDLSFVPCLLAFALRSLIAAHNDRNYSIAAVLAMYWIADLLCWLDPVFGLPTWDRGITLGFDIVLLLIVIIGGRVIPSFTTNYLNRLGLGPAIKMGTMLDKLAMASILLLTVVDQLRFGDRLTGLIVAAVALLQGLRLAHWRSWKIRHEPLVWILHVAYAWVPVGLALQAAHLLTHASFASAWRHAFSIGVFSCMVLGIMSRAALGHTGRALHAAKPTVASYILLIAAGIVRVFIAPLLTGAYYQDALAASGLLWGLAFLFFVIVYSPILIFARPDGRAG